MPKKPKAEFRLIPVNTIKTSKFHHKLDHTKEAIEETARQIASTRTGLINPVLVRDVNGRLELLAGSRRIQAVRKLGLTSILAHIVQVDDIEAEKLSIYENDRTDMPPSMKNAHIKRAVELEVLGQGKKIPDGKAIDTVALKMGKTKRQVQTAIRQDEKLSPEVKKALDEGKISTSHAEELESLDPVSQRILLKGILKKGLTVEDVATKKQERKITKEEDKDAAYRATAKRYLAGTLSLGLRFKDSLTTLNEHAEAHKVDLSALPSEADKDDLQAVMTALDWTLSLLSGGC